jgi:hypothetical protein
MRMIQECEVEQSCLRTLEEGRWRLHGLGIWMQKSVQRNAMERLKIAVNDNQLNVNVSLAAIAKNAKQHSAQWINLMYLYV